MFLFQVRRSLTALPTPPPPPPSPPTRWPSAWGGRTSDPPSRAGEGLGMAPVLVVKACCCRFLVSDLVCMLQKRINFFKKNQIISTPAPASSVPTAPPCSPPRKSDSPPPSPWESPCSSSPLSFRGRGWRTFPYWCWTWRQSEWRAKSIFPCI